MVVCIGDCAVLSELGWAGLKDGWEGLGAVREPHPSFRLARGVVGGLSGPRITLMAQIFADAPPVCPGFWIPACAGMTVEVGGLRRWAMMPRALLSRWLSVSGIARVV